MTTTNKQRREQRARKDKARRERDARDAEELREHGRRENYRRQLADAGFSDPELALHRLEVQALHSMAPRLDVLVERACKAQREPPPVELKPDPYFHAGDTYTFSTSPPSGTLNDLKQAAAQLPMRRRLSPMLRTALALSLVGLTVPDPPRRG